MAIHNSDLTITVTSLSLFFDMENFIKFKQIYPLEYSPNKPIFV